jgi:predicted MFS family arabinose efflux permease
MGPAAAGLIYALVGPAWCFTLNALSFIGVLTALARMRLVPRSMEKNAQRDDLLGGLRFLWTEKNVGILIILELVISLFGFSFVTLIPAWAVKILGGNATTNGLLQSARGIGALLGAFTMAVIGNSPLKGKLLTVASIGFPLILFAFILVRQPLLSLIILGGVGAALVIIFNLINTLVQLHTPEPLRGRVLGVYTFAFAGFTPIGGLLAGTLATYFGEPLTIGLCTLITLIVALVIWLWRPQLSQYRCVNESKRGR